MAIAAQRRTSLEPEANLHRLRAVEGPHEREIRDRLSRASGQLRGVEGMYESGRWCTEVLDQIAGVRRALDGIALLLIDDHISACLGQDTHTAADVAGLLDGVRRYIRTL